jgi:hypothetical protein
VAARRLRRDRLVYGGALTAVPSFFTNVYVAGILSNLIALVIVAVLGGVSYWLFLRRVLVFFGLPRKGIRRVLIYTSRLDVPLGASRGIDGSLRSFRGTSVPGYETRIVEQFADFFTRGSHHNRLLHWADIEVKSLASPASKADIWREGTLITIGSPGYNIVSGAAEDDFNAPVRFTNDNSELATRDGDRVGGTYAGVAMRTVRPTTGQVVFYLAGPSERGTTAAVNYLLSEWRALAKRQREWRGLRRHLKDQFYTVVEATSEDGEQYTITKQSD